MAISSNPALAQLISQLKKWKPSQLKVLTHQGDVKDVVIPQSGQRRRWEHVQKTLDAIAWVKVEALTGKGALLGVYEHPDYEIGDLEDLEFEQYTGKAGETAQLLSLMLRAQDVALKRDTERLERLLTAHITLLEVMAKRLVAAERDAMDNLNALQNLARAAANAAGDEEPGSMSGAMLAQLLPALLKGEGPAAAAAAPAPPNGKPAG